jgi:hypothetical protein
VADSVVVLGAGISASFGCLLACYRWVCVVLLLGLGVGLGVSCLGLAVGWCGVVCKCFAALALGMYLGR